MADASFGPAWPNCDRARIVTLTRHDGLRLPVHRDMADLVAVLMDLTELAGYDIHPGETWGYACRAIAGTNQPSNHSQGTAVDINAPHNPRRARGLPMITDLPAKVIDLWTSHGFRWGGRFTWPDPMHFEFMGTAAQARAIAAQLRHFLSSAPPPPAHPGLPAARPYPGVVRRGDRSAAVATWQGVLHDRGYAVTADGVFGPITEVAVRDWQRRHHLVVDGVAGPDTWHSLLFAVN